MHLVVVHKSAGSAESASDSLLRLAFSCKPLTDIVIGRMSEFCGLRGDDFALVLPGQWKQAGKAANSGILYYDDKIPVPAVRQSPRRKSWFVVSNGRFLAQTDLRLLYKTIARMDADVVAVNVEPQLAAGSEKVIADSNRNLVGFRMLYADAVQPALLPPDWPHHLFVSSFVFDRIFNGEWLPVAFDEFIDRCYCRSVTMSSVEAGGIVLDLNTDRGLLSVLSAKQMREAGWHSGRTADNRSTDNNSLSISKGARLFGNIAFGQNISIGADAIVEGPAVIGNGVSIADSAVVRECIIGPNVSLPYGSVVQNRVITDSRQISQQFPESGKDKSFPDASINLSKIDFNLSRFRIWPKLSYAGCVKRIADIVMATVVLMIFAPVLPIISAIVKLSSRGPVFFKDIRQGLRGRPFVCLKFRTMQEGAAEIQEKLRVINEADGPQFVIADDPRLNKVGRFLRETYLDEIPQFFAVLTGRMSVVGPRPSPESENVLCPFWRDARLSVRPGITGLWQVCRTRQPMKDFQEWIHYDVEYVRNLSMRLDIWICWRTAKKMIANFVRQF
jgi:lipopolysaccharide/colanic/teichoic acid biosynthesis glycosyltransferase